MNRLFPGQLEAVGPPFVFNTKLGGPIVSLANEHPRIGSKQSIKGNDLTSHPITFKSLRAAVMPGFCFKNGHRFGDKRSLAHLVIASKKAWSLTWPFSLLDCRKVEFALVFWDSPPLLANFHKLLLTRPSWMSPICDLTPSSALTAYWKLFTTQLSMN
jgi:hypothetical protein